jgi:hypothetical protein
MSSSFDIDNFPRVVLGEETFLTVKADVGANPLSIDNVEGISANTFALLSRPGSNDAELIQIISVTAPSTLTLASVVAHGHAAFDPVNVLFFNVVDIFRAPDVNSKPPDISTYISLDTIGIDPDKMQTPYQDTAGSNAFWYLFRYRNTITGDATDLADVEPVRGGDEAGYATLYDIRSEAGFEKSKNLPDATVSMYRRRAQAEVDSKLGSSFVVPFDPVPDAINEITTLLAAGWLLLKEYGALKSGTTNKEGGAKLKEGRDWIVMLQTGTAALPDAAVLGGEIQREPEILGGPIDEEPVFRMEHNF